MALPSTMHRFEIELSDIDEGQYERLELRIARHPSEGLPYLMTRILVWALRRNDDVEMSRSGLCTSEEPAILARDLTGGIKHWIDIGSPSPDRVHKASKTAENVSIYTYKKAGLLVDALNRIHVHRRHEIQLYEVDPVFLDRLGQTLARTNEWTVVRTDGVLYVTAAGSTFETAFNRHALDPS